MSTPRVDDGGGETEAADLPSRLRRFVQAVVEETRARAAFVSDESGLEVVSHGAEGPWMALAGQALSHLKEMRLALRSEETPAATFSLGSGLRLHVVEVPTDHGRFALGAVGGGLDVRELTAYRDRLQALMC